MAGPEYELQTVLSDKPSELIRQALRDLAAVEQREECRVDMSTYVDINSPEPGAAPCMLCLAGAVMYQGTPEMQESLQDGNIEINMPCDYDGCDVMKLRFLSDLQFGEFEVAFNELGVPRPDWLVAKDRTFPKYENDPVVYKQALTDLADKLEQDSL